MPVQACSCSLAARGALCQPLARLLCQASTSPKREEARSSRRPQPYILEHLPEIAACLAHPAAFAYLHVPVSGRRGWGRDRGMPGPRGKGALCYPVLLLHLALQHLLALRHHALYRTWI